MKYHRLIKPNQDWQRNLKRFFPRLLCLVVGHRINNEPDCHWCQRCGLAYSECYHPKDFYVNFIGESRISHISISEEEIRKDAEEFVSGFFLEIEKPKNCPICTQVNYGCSVKCVNCGRKFPEIL